MYTLGCYCVLRFTHAFFWSEVIDYLRYDAQVKPGNEAKELLCLLSPSGLIAS